jgi:hypothetical protein
VPRIALTASGRRPRTTRLPLTLVAASLAAICIGGCGGSGSPAPDTTVSSGPSVITSPRQDVTFAALTGAIEQLYQHQPTIRTFIAQDVEYTPTTRDKVLTVCRIGGPETNQAALESAKIVACAPLVFFFYEYGRQKSDPESLDVARKVYWYAATNIHGPFSAKKALTTLLQSWGIS